MLAFLQVFKSLQGFVPGRWQGDFDATFSISSNVNDSGINHFAGLLNVLKL